jgi:hypothetical protein
MYGRRRLWQMKFVPQGINLPEFRASGLSWNSEVFLHVIEKVDGVRSRYAAAVQLGSHSAET